MNVNKCMYVCKYICMYVYLSVRVLVRLGCMQVILYLCILKGGPAFM